MRRDRLLLPNAVAIVLLTLLGAAGESLGMDRHLKVNTVKHRTHSLFRQGCMLYDLIPNMPKARLRPLVERFVDMISGQAQESSGDQVAPGGLDNLAHRNERTSNDQDGPLDRIVRQRDLAEQQRLHGLKLGCASVANMTLFSVRAAVH